VRTLAVKKRMSRNFGEAGKCGRSLPSAEEEEGDGSSEGGGKPKRGRQKNLVGPRGKRSEEIKKRWGSVVTAPVPAEKGISGASDRLKREKIKTLKQGSVEGV